MKKTARKPLLLLAVFLSFVGSGYYNPLAEPEIKPPISRPAEPPQIKLYNEPTPIVDSSSVLLPAPDPRIYLGETGKHREYFVPASESRPPERFMSIPVVDKTYKAAFDLNEWEEKRFFSSNMYTDTSIYSTHVKGDKSLSPRDKGSFYDVNYRYELFTSKVGGDSLSLNIDATYTNNKRRYEDGFTLNHFSLESNTNRSRMVLGDAFPEMSPYSFTQEIMGAYGVQYFDSTAVSMFGGYHAPDKSDIKNPRYVGGMRLEHARDDSFQVGLNIVGLNDKRENAGSTLLDPTMYSRILSLDARVRPTENLYLTAEIAQSETDFDKRAGAGRLRGGAYNTVAGYEKQGYRLEAGIEKADTEFASPLGQAPRDEESAFARFYYDLNKYISGKAGIRSSKDNIANYLSSTIKREETEFQVTVRPSEYYKNMRFDFFYRPTHEFSDTPGFMSIYKDMYWLEFNNRTGNMLYYLALSQTLDRDDIDMTNDSDTRRYDLSLTWEYDKNNKVYGSLGIEDVTYKRANLNEKSRWLGLGGASKFSDAVLIALDYRRENLNPHTVSSVHDWLNLSLTREYSKSTSLVIDLEANKSEFAQEGANYEDYTAKLRLLKAF